MVAPQGRAVSPKMKRVVMNRILAAWCDAPDLRLGQLLYVVTRTPDLFNIEDEALAGAVEQAVKDNFARPGDH